MRTLTTTIRLLTNTLFCSLLMIPVTQASSEAANPSPTTTSKTAKSLSKPVTQTKSTVIEHLGKAKTPNTSTVTKKSNVTQTADAVANHEVWIDSVDIHLYDDPNHNGYFNRIIVDFDADTIYNHIDVYATLSLTDPNGIETDYYTTGNIALYGDTFTDQHQVDTVLTANWMAEGYDLSIYLYDSYTNEQVAHINSYNAPQLAYLTLESLDYEYSANQYLTLFSAQSWLVSDSDGDGYYHSIDLDVDIDVNYSSTSVFAEMVISSDGDNWQPLYTSDHFVVNENDTFDKQHWHLDFANGYPPGHYFIKIAIVDSESYQTILTIEPDDHAALYALPLEDRNNEITITPPPVEPPKQAVSKEHAGAGSPLMIGLLMLLGLRRRGDRR